MATTDPVKEKILEQADIVETVSQYVRLQNRGGRYFGLCPFHQEKTPSFSVNPERGFFHCFGCGQGGNVIDFIMGVETLTYSEARRLLADKLGIPIETSSRKKKPHGEIDRYQVMELSAKAYAKTLSSNQTAMEYLKGRGLSGEHIKQFGLGYAPDSWDFLHTELKRKKIPETVQQELGLTVPRKQGVGHYDRFRKRIMFPIRNTLGRVIAFGGRSLDKDAQAKYLNSTDTPLFNKSKVLYLLDRAKNCMKERGAVIVEGYMDAIALHAQGFDHTVATLGTALTRDHAKILHRYTRSFVLFYDGDSAGIKAAMRGVETFFESGLSVRVATPPGGQDPDDYVRANGAEALQKLLDDAPDGYDFYLRQASKELDHTTPDGKTAIVEAMLPLLSRVSEAFVLKDYVRELAGRLGSDLDPLENAIRAKLRKGIYTNAPQRPAEPAPAQPQRSTNIHKETLIRLLAFHIGIVTPDRMQPHDRPSLFTQDDIERRIPEQIPYLPKDEALDPIIKKLLHPPQIEKQSSEAARLAELFPESGERALLISILEKIPLPNTEKALRTMRDDFFTTLDQATQKTQFETIKRGADGNDPQALQAMNDLIFTKREEEKQS